MTKFDQWDILYNEVYPCTKNMNKIPVKKEVIHLYDQYGQQLSEITRNVKSDILNIPNIKNSLDVIQKKPEFEPDTLSIRTTWWDDTTIRDYDGKNHLKMLINSTEDVIEYKEDIVQWEQLFIWYETFVKAACNKKHCTPEELESKYLPTEEKMTAIAGPQRQNTSEYKAFYDQYIRNRKKPWYLIPRNKKLGQVGNKVYIRAIWGDDIEFSEDGWKITKGGKWYWFSGRLLK